MIKFQLPFSSFHAAFHAMQFDFDSKYLILNVNIVLDRRHVM